MSDLLNIFNANKQSNFVEFKKISDLETGQQYKIKSAEIIKSKFDKTIMLKLENNWAINLPKKFTANMKDEHIEEFKNDYAIIYNGKEKCGSYEMDKIELVKN